MRRPTGPGCRTIILLACAAFAATSPSAAQQEPADTRPSEPPSPHAALWRAAVVPGWGQIHNRQLYKAPIVWAGLTGLLGSAIYVNRRYLANRRAHLWAVRTSATLEVSPHYEADYLELAVRLGLTPEEADTPARRTQLARLFRQNRDRFRRNRDLLYIGLGMFHGLSILDAYVSAHLLDFDVSEDLTLSFAPTPGGIAAQLRWGGHNHR